MMTILRETILKSLYQSIQNSLHKRESAVIEIVGDRGTGKTILIDQLDHYLSQTGLDIQFMSLKASRQDSITDLLQGAVDDLGIGDLSDYRPDSLAGGVYRMLLQLRDPSRDMMILCIDNTQHLNSESITALHGVFHPLWTTQPMICVLVGHPGWEGDNALTLDGYSDTEAQEHIVQRIHTEWSPILTDRLEWLIDQCQSNPMKLDRLIDHLIEKQLLSDKGYIAPLENLQLAELPEELSAIPAPLDPAGLINSSEQGSWSTSKQKAMVKRAIELDRQGQFQSALDIWKRLQELNPGPKHLHNMGRMHFKLYEHEKALDCFQQLTELDGYRNLPKVEYYFAVSLQELGNGEKADFHFQRVFKFMPPSHKDYPKLYTQYIQFLLQQGFQERATSALREFKSLSESSPSLRLEYINLVCGLSEMMDIGIDVPKLCKEGITIAGKRKDYRLLCGLEQCQVVHFIKTGEYQQALHHAKLAGKYNRQDFFPANEAKHIKTLGVIHFHLQQYDLAVSSLKQAREMFRYLEVLPEEIDCLQTLASVYGLIGFTKAVIEILPELDKLLQGPISVNDLIPRFSLASFNYHVENQEVAQEQFKSLLTICESNQFEMLSMYIKDHLYPILFNSDTQLAIRYSQESFAYFERTKNVTTLLNYFFRRSWTEISHQDIRRLRTTLDVWEDSIAYKADTFHYQTARACFEVLSGNTRSALTRIHQIELNHEGRYLWEWYHLYRWLSGESIPSKYRKRYKLRAELLEQICLGYKISKKHLSLKNPEPLDQFFQSWAQAMHSNQTIDHDVLEMLSQDVEIIDRWERTLRVWGITVVDDPEIPASLTGSPIVFQLLGKPQIIINGRILSSRDWTSRKALEVLLYILIKSYRHHTSVDNRDLLHDLWAPKTDKMDACRAVRDNMVSRARKIFNTMPVRMLTTEDNEMSFNWESGLYRLDLLQFTEAFNASKSAHNEGNYDTAKAQLNIALSMHRGDLLEGFDGQWLDSERAYFKAQFEECLRLLLQCD